jgi:methanogenic corrinoid protein MtbC1
MALPPFSVLSAAPAALNRMVARFFLPSQPAAAQPDNEPDFILAARAIAFRIIPQLVVAHSAGASPSVARGAPRMSEDNFDDFIGLLIRNDMAGCEAAVDALAACGATFAQLCQDLLTRAARRLGAMWEEDDCDFFDVTEGLGALHTLLHRAADRFDRAHRLREAPGRVLLASLPGEHHSFGLQMVGEAFRLAGWDVVMAPETGEAELASLVAGGRFAVAGLSMANARQTGAMTRTIQTLRAASAHPGIGILVGGPAFVTRPELAHLLGADVTAMDAAQAVCRAEELRILSAAKEEGASF